MVKGDLKTLTGVVSSVSGDGTVNMIADVKELQGEAIALRATDLAKNILTGMHVRVTAGRHEGATGMVVRVDGDVAVLVTDILKEEIQARPPRTHRPHDPAAAARMPVSPGASPGRPILPKPRPARAPSLRPRRASDAPFPRAAAARRAPCRFSGRT